MPVQNGFEDLVLTIGTETEYLPLSHLQDLQIQIDDFELESKHKVTLTVYIRPTNHLYSRRFDGALDNEAGLSQTGELLLRYEHYPGNFQAKKPDGQISTEKRVFCRTKYEQSKLFPSFIDYVSANLSNICVLPNKGNTRTCLSALMALPPPYAQDESYLVFFTLHKVNSKEVNMLIETAFVENNNDFRVKMLLGETAKDEMKPFLVLLRNILAGRGPFEGMVKKTAKKIYKKKKKAKTK
ncbi:hypothetical protein HJ196_23290 [Vibrio parahaemolyticus]|uniref:hypothetical protein n=1 Tax=Vibrio parahaemolyticus TaxID=670 RepID=UPI00040206AA|nr:hypothetical protein [Vibrio parahaemolyticus]EGQ9055240.1 hypothetical protein [Vibrio parahaemolyticus]EGR3304446.1 hypothetical protein [Vibrio parahaemolyticus]EGR3320701.1 hypothetical protein [Vibrio parahaemolyticus]EIW7482832.1 hypothetical protein [Vibrio parahaemolyticus]EKZ9251941.1 hypothetical protein [Vibrio parahaemolyticus]